MCSDNIIELLILGHHRKQMNFPQLSLALQCILVSKYLHAQILAMYLTFTFEVQSAKFVLIEVANDD